MNAQGLLIELYERIPPLVAAACDSLDERSLTTQSAGGGNTIGWLLWHLSRVQRPRAYLGSLDGARLDDVIDDAWNPPVTLGVRLVSVADDSLQHAGQAAYLRGLIERAAA